MPNPLDSTSCARVPARSLGVLAGLRREESIRVRVDGDWAWVFWDSGDGRVVRALLPAEGVELYERSREGWRRPGKLLPSPGVPSEEGALPLHRVIFPEPVAAEMPRPGPIEPVRLRLVRSDRPRPASAVLGPLAELARWAESATSAEIEALRGAIAGDRALVIGPGVPTLADSTRYWGESVLVPLGFEPRPRFGDPALRAMLGAPEGAIVRLEPTGPDGSDAAFEAIPGEALGPLTRAGVRLAMAEVEAEGGQAR